MKVGQKLWFVSAYGYGIAREVEVLKVGRKYITFKYCGYAQSSTFPDEDGYIHSRLRDCLGRIYQSKEAYDAEMARQNAWRDLRQRTAGGYPPPNVSMENIMAAMELLK